MKVDTKVEPIKRRGYSTFDRLDNSKLKRKKKKTNSVNNKHGKKQRHVDDDDVPRLPKKIAVPPGVLLPDSGIFPTRATLSTYSMFKETPSMSLSPKKIWTSLKPI